MIVVDFLKESNRWKHLVGGVLIGLGSSDAYCATYAGVGIAGALEFKDKAHGCKADWIDFTCTVVGVAIGYGMRLGIINIIETC